jgi:hypothetical protein
MKTLPSSDYARKEYKKSLASFSSPVGMLLTKLSLAGNNLIIPGQEEIGK